MPEPMLLGVVGVLGLAVGSFLNVVIYRVPRDESLIRPGSHCPHCAAAVRNRHNVPVLGWLMLRGRCADCRTPIGVRYPLIEAGTAVLFVAVAARFGWSWALPAYLYLAAVAIALAAIDLDVMRLPDKIVLPSYSVAPLLFIPAAVAGGSWDAVIRSLIAATLFYALYRLLAVLPNGMGGGDVKLAPLLGLYPSSRPQEPHPVRPLHARGRVPRGFRRRADRPLVLGPAHLRGLIVILSPWRHTPCTTPSAGFAPGRKTRASPSSSSWSWWSSSAYWSPSPCRST
jgi:leader peptidase (prepilin peptidase)/N-methyltransferase